MAIDSARKRKSISSIGLPFLAPGITPDATAPWQWRQTSAWSYAGIATAAVHVPNVTGPADEYTFTTPSADYYTYLTPPPDEYTVTTPPGDEYPL